MSLTSAQPRPVSTFRPDVEGLRAVAVLLVIADHLVSEPSGGFVGVDVFFVISGFLITQLMVREYGSTRRISLKNFYERRARRILPMALLVLLVCWLVAKALFFANRARETGVDVLWSAVFLANLHFARTDTDYFAADRGQSPVQHYWSLAVEEQFYVVWPLLLFAVLWLAGRLVPRHARLAATAGTGVLLLALFAWSVRLTSDDRATAYFATSARAWELGAGAVLALGAVWLREAPPVLMRAATPAGLVLIAVTAVVISPTSAFPAPAALGAVAGTVLVLFGGFDGGTSRAAWLLTNPVMRYVGLISYSLYLWHWPVIVFLQARLEAGNAYFDVAALLLMFGLSVASFHLVEDPLRRHRFGRRRVRTPGATAIRTALVGTRGTAALVAVVLIVAAFVTWTARPFPAVRDFATAAPVAGADASADGPRPFGQLSPPAVLSSDITAALAADRFPALNPSLGEASDDRPSEWTRCGNVSSPDAVARCTFPRTAGPNRGTLVVIGDSFAISWLPAIRAEQRNGYTVVAVTYGQCPAADVTVDEAVGASSGFYRVCDAQRTYAVTQVARLKPAVVVLASLFDTVGRLHDGAKGADALEQWQTGTGRMIQRVRKAGAKRVVLLASPPEGRATATCATSSDANPQNCVAAVADLWFDVADAERAAAKAAGATYLDTRLFFCSATNYCPSFVGTRVARFDGSHLSSAYAARLGPYLAAPIAGDSR